MTPKSSKQTRSRFRATIRTALTLAALAGWPLTAIRAQSPEEKPPTTPRAYIRFWNMLPDTPDNDLVLLAGEKTGLGILPPGNIYANYLAAPAGSYTLTVRRLGEKSGALKQLPVALSDKTFLTLLATEKDGRPTVEMFDDTPDPKVVEAYARIVLRQFFPGAHVRASVTGLPSSPSLDYGQTAALENVPPNAQTSIRLQAVLPTTPPTTREWTLTADFSTARHATLLLVADAYGRFRPRLAYDGQLGAAPAPAPAASP